MLESLFLSPLERPSPRGRKGTGPLSFCQIHTNALWSRAFPSFLNFANIGIRKRWEPRQRPPKAPCCAVLGNHLAFLGNTGMTIPTSISEDGPWGRLQGAGVLRQRGPQTLERSDLCWSPCGTAVPPWRRRKIKFKAVTATLQGARLVWVRGIQGEARQARFPPNSSPQTLTG